MVTIQDSQKRPLFTDMPKPRAARACQPYTLPVARIESPCSSDDKRKRPALRSSRRYTQPALLIRFEKPKIAPAYSRSHKALMAFSAFCREENAMSDRDAAFSLWRRQELFLSLLPRLSLPFFACFFFPSSRHHVAQMFLLPSSTTDAVP